MFEKGDQVVLSNGDICTIVEYRTQDYDTDYDVYLAEWPDGFTMLIDETDIDGPY